MDVQASIEQVAGILVRDELEFDTHPDGDAYRLLFGSSAVFVNFDTHGDDGVVITVSAPVLQEIDEEGPGAALMLNRLNELNRSHRFVKFVFHEGVLVAACDLLGDTLQARELLNAIYTVGGVAEHYGEDLAEESGGKVYATIAEERALHEDD